MHKTTCVVSLLNIRKNFRPVCVLWVNIRVARQTVWGTSTSFHICPLMFPKWISVPCLHDPTCLIALRPTWKGSGPQLKSPSCNGNLSERRLDSDHLSLKDASPRKLFLYLLEANSVIHISSYHRHCSCVTHFNADRQASARTQTVLSIPNWFIQHF